MAFTDWLYNLIAKRRGWPTASEMQVLSDTPLEKSIEEYAQLAVAPSGARGQEPAPWQNDRNEFVKHYKNSVYVAVGAIARKVATQKVIVSRRTIDEQGEKLEPVGLDHPLQQLFMEVNPRDTQWDLWFYTAAWRLVVGESYWWKARNGFGLPKELWHLPPQWVHAIPSETHYIDGYRVEGVFGKDPVDIPSEDVVHLREPSLDWSGTGRYYGTPALAAAATPVDLEDAMYKRLYHSFKNYAPPAEKFVTDQELTQQQVMEVYRQVMSQHRAAEHTGRPMILHSGLKPVGGMMPQEMSYQESLETTMDSILSIFGVPKAVVGLVSDTNRCLDEETECLTDAGWIKGNEITMQTRIACYDSDRQVITYKKPSGHFFKPYKGEMLHWSSDVADVMVTPNHRMLVSGETGVESVEFADQSASRKAFNLLVAPPMGAACEEPVSVTLGPPELPSQLLPRVDDNVWYSLDELSSAIGKSERTIRQWLYDGRVPCKRDGQFAPPLILGRHVNELSIRTRGASTMRTQPVTIDSDVWLEFLGWFVSEGSTNLRVDSRGRNSSTVFLTQKDGTEDAEKIALMLESMPFIFHTCVTDAGQRQWACHDSGLVDHLRRHCGVGSHNKRVPSYVKDYPASALRLLLDAAIAGDGHVSKTHKNLVTYTTASRQLADDIQELAVKCGWRASITEYESRTDRHHKSFNVNINTDRHRVSLRNSQNLQRVEYDGNIWCVQVPTTFFVVRRNGKVHVTGNSNMEAALESFCQNTINPMLEHIGQHLTQGLAREFEPDLVVHFKPCTVGDTKALHDAWRLANSAHAVTADEIRDELLGKGPLSSGGDVVRNRTGEPIGAGNVDDDELFDEPESEESAEAEEPDDTDEADIQDDATEKASYKPTAGMKSEAAKGLAWRKEHNRGGTAVGVARARDIVNGRELSLDTVKRMHSFFSRHEVDKKGKGFSPGEDGFPSAGRIAWALWGGDAGQSWARKITQSVDKASEIDSDAEQVKDIADVLAERQIAKYEADAMKVVTEAIAEALVDDPPTNGHGVNGSANRLSSMMGEG